MSPSESDLREVFESASRAQSELDTRVFHLKILYETACELSEFTQPRRIMETYLLTAMGIFGFARGLAILFNTRTQQGHMVHRGLGGPDAEACERNLARIAAHCLNEGLPPPQAVIATPAPAGASGLLPADTTVVLKQSVHQDFAVLAAFGTRLCGQPLVDADATTLLNLTGTMTGALAHTLFDRHIEHLSAGLMRQSADLQNALQQAEHSRANLDRRIFHLQTLYEFTGELSPVIATEKLLETFLLTAMGTFGASAGTVLLCDRKNRKVRCFRRGGPQGCEWSLEEAEKLLYRGFQATEARRLDPMSVGFIVDPQSVFSASAIGFSVHSAALFTVDDTLLGFTALGAPLGRPGLDADERELLRGLTANLMVFLKNARAFETIQALNEDLRLTNTDLRRTIADLTEARHQIRILELAKSRLKQLIQREIERGGRLRPADVLLVLVTSAVLALVFNFSSPNGIPVLPESVFQEPAPRIDALTAHQMASRGEAVLVDARPAELFEQKHLPEAVSLPAALFDILYPMKLGRMLKPEQTVLVYGRTISRRYDDDVAQKLLQRHENIRVLEEGVQGWEAKGLPVAP
jgi:rhodanese-related sulfurtransferase